ncbi:MAG TPA: GntR family transcriptional regulator [Solirubrobacteraceae bacterium]|nr:GntR family transcriptional regulator [Solirubrobacteraceae bacterium]
MTATTTITKQERVYQTLRERILSGVYGPGFRVVIDALADEFSVSALPVREAIRRLEAEGLVTYRPNAGAQVAPADPAQFAEEMSVLAVLEAYATALAAAALTATDLVALRELNAAMEQAMARVDSLEFGRLNQEFHGRIFASCPNASLVATLRDVGRRLDAIRRTVFVQIPYRGAESIAEHRRMIELIERRAPAAEIEELARQHKLNTLETFRAWVEERDAQPAEAATR